RFSWLARSLGLTGGDASPSGNSSSPRGSGGGALSPGLAAEPLLNAVSPILGLMTEVDQSYRVDKLKV
ncbi:MAG: hypothetical protein LBP95_07260, partial [Deltaproteobacteria bacterium]|nr:hypothetical protein [Deltaproteobacteria bacterium]